MPKGFYTDDRGRVRVRLVAGGGRRSRSALLAGLIALSAVGYGGAVGLSTGGAAGGGGPGPSVEDRRDAGGELARRGDADGAWRRMGLHGLKRTEKQRTECVDAAFGGGNIIEHPNLFFAVAIVQPGKTPDEAIKALIGQFERLKADLKSLEEGNRLTISDNGRGIPVDEHPKFPGKSSLEVILTTLHSGGKFSGKAYATSGGLHGVGVSVVNALSEHTRVEVARDKQLYAQEFSQGHPTGNIQELGPVPNRRGTTVTFVPDPEIFGDRAFSPKRLFKLALKQFLPKPGPPGLGAPTNPPGTHPHARGRARPLANSAYQVSGSLSLYFRSSTNVHRGDCVRR